MNSLPRTDAVCSAIIGFLPNAQYSSGARPSAPRKDAKIHYNGNHRSPKADHNPAKANCCRIYGAICCPISTLYGCTILSTTELFKIPWMGFCVVAFAQQPERSTSLRIIADRISGLQIRSRIAPRRYHSPPKARIAQCSIKSRASTIMACDRYTARLGKRGFPEIRMPMTWLPKRCNSFATELPGRCRTNDTKVCVF